MSQFESDESKWARLAENSLEMKGKGRVAKTFKLLALGSKGEKKNAKGRLLGNKVVPKGLINYVEAVGTMEAANTAIIILSDLLDPEMKGKVRDRFANKYNDIKLKYSRLSKKHFSKEKVKEKVKKQHEKKLMEKRGLNKKEETEKVEEREKEREEMDEEPQKAPKEELKELKNIVGSAIDEANTNPEVITEEKLDDFSKALVSLDMGVNVDIFKEALKNVRESAIEFGSTQSACRELSDSVSELARINLDDVNTLAAALARFMAIVRERTKILETQLSLKSSENDKLSMEISLLNQKANKATLEATDLRAQLESKTANLKELNKEMASLTTKYNIAQESLKSAQQQISETDVDFKSRTEKANKDMLILRQNYSSLEVEKQKLSREIENIRIELSEKNEEVSKLGGQLVAYEETNKMLSRTDLKKANEIESLNKTIGLLNENITQIQNKLSFKESEYNSFREIKEREIQDLMQDIEKQKALMVDYNALESKNAELEATIESFRVQKESLQRSLDEKDKAYALLRTQGLADAEKQKELAQDRVNTKGVIADLENQINELKTQIDLNNAKTAAFKAENEKLAARVVASEKERDSAVQINQAIKNEFDETKKMLAASEQKVNQLELNLATEAKNKLEAQKQCEMAKLQLEKANQESLKLKSELFNAASAKIVKLESNLKVLDELKNKAFIVPPKELINDAGKQADGSVQVSVARVVYDEPPIRMEAIKNILHKVAGPIKKKKDTSPLKSPSSLAAKKRSLNKTSGAYLVGGRPDPAFNKGKKFWKNVYNKSFKLF